MKLLPVHNFDPEFKSASSILKKILKKHFGANGKQTLDIPCGTGRNIFLLSNYFDKVIGIDKEDDYLSAVTCIKDQYPKSNIELKKHDVLKGDLGDLNDFDLICNIHFFDSKLTLQLIKGLRTGAFLYLETPECRGRNFMDLPTEMELNSILKGQTILFYKFRPCGHKENALHAGAVQVLIQKN